MTRLRLFVTPTSFTSLCALLLAIASSAAAQAVITSIPANDQCAGAQVIPGSGPFPHLTSVVNISQATTTGDPAPPSCQSYVSRSVWYSFRPAASGSYTISSCASSGAATTVEDNVMAIYTSAAGCSGPFSQVIGGCNDDGCGAGSYQSTITRQFSQDTTYYVVVWKYGLTAPGVGKTDVQLAVTQHLPPANELCATAAPLMLDVPVTGSTAWAVDHYRLSGQLCYTGLQQITSPAAGGDAVYSFIAPSAGQYSFKVSRYSLTSDLVIYLASSCPSGPYPATVTSCIAASNRSTSSSSEELICVTLSQNQQVYLVVDEHGPSSGSPFLVEVNRCLRETEPNNTPATAQAVTQGITGAINPDGEVDVYALGTPAAGSRVFAMVDGSAGNRTDFDLRVTTTTDVLEYDDADNDTPFGSLSPNVAGTQLTGVPAFLRVTMFSSGYFAEPYRLYTTVQPPSTQAAGEREPNNTRDDASYATANYFSGTLSGPVPSTDVDWYGFTARQGDILFIALDGDPLRDNTPLNAALSLHASDGTTLASVNDSRAASSTTSGAGSLSSTTPHSPGEALVHRAPATGIYYVRVASGSLVANPSSGGDYLLSVSRNGMIGDGGLPADLRVQVSGPDSAATGYPISWQVTITNHGPAIATNVGMLDSLPAGTTFLSVQAPSGVCAVPPVGTTGVVSCGIDTLQRGASATWTIRALVTAPAGTSILNRTRVVPGGHDLDSTNNAASLRSEIVSIAADLSVTGRFLADSVIAATTVQRRVVVRNNGPSTASGVVAADTLYPGAFFESIGAVPGWTVQTPAVGTSGVIRATRSSMAPGDSAVFLVTLRVDPFIADRSMLRACAAVDAPLLDPEPGNNTSCSAVLALNRSPRIELDGSIAVVATGCEYPKRPASFSRALVVRNANTAFNVGDMEWFATTTAPEITIGRSSGMEGDSLTFVVSPKGLAFGTHTRTITITARNAMTLAPAENAPYALTVRIDISPSGGEVITQTKSISGSWTAFTNSLGQTIAEVRSNSGPIADFTVTCHPCDIADGYSRMSYIYRWFTLSTPASNPNVDVRFHYTDSERTAFAVHDPSALRAWRQYPAPGAWHPTVSSSDPMTNTVTATGITQLGDVWALAAPPSVRPLPMRARAGRNGSAVDLQWESEARPMSDTWVVERRASDDAPWQAVALVGWIGSATHVWRDQSEGGEDAASDRRAWRIVAWDDGARLESDPVRAGATSVLTASSIGMPASMTLERPAPHPVRASAGTPAGITFTLPAAGDVTLRVYDLFGREVRRVLDARLNAGAHVARFDAGGLPAGTYVARLTADGVSITRSLVVVE